MMTDISGVGDSAIQSNYLIVQATGFLLIVQRFVTTLSGTLVSTPIGVYAPRIPYYGVRLKPFHASSLLTPQAFSRLLPAVRTSTFEPARAPEIRSPYREAAPLHRDGQSGWPHLQSRDPSVRFRDYNSGQPAPGATPAGQYATRNRIAPSTVPFRSRVDCTDRHRDYPPDHSGIRLTRRTRVPF